MSSDKGSAAGAEYAVTPPPQTPTTTTTAPAQKKGVGRHCKRFWWAYLIALACIVVLVVPLVIIVGVKNIAQGKVDGARLVLDSLVASNTQANNFTLSINSTLYASGGISATVEAFTGEMYLEDYPTKETFATVNFPETRNVKEQVVNLTQFTTIPDIAAFTRFNTWILFNDTVRVTVAGKTHVRVKGISRRYPVNFKKTVELEGLRGFVPTNVTNSTVRIPADERGNDFTGYASVPNYSKLTFDIGNATFDTYLQGQYAGNTTLYNVILRPGIGGINNFTMGSNITTSLALAAAAAAPWCEEDGTVPFVLHGTNVTNNGQFLSYYADALRAGNITVQIPLKQAIEATGINITCASSSSSS